MAVRSMPMPDPMFIYTMLALRTIQPTWGGIYSDSANLNFRNVTFSGNEATEDTGGDYGHGGAIFADGGTIDVIGSIYIDDNKACNNGGGLYLNQTSFVANNGYIQYNEAGQDGGGIYMKDSYVRLGGNFDVYENDAGRHGGGIFQTDTGTDPSEYGVNTYNSTTGTWQEGLVINGATISNNASERNGGGIFNNNGMVVARDSAYGPSNIFGNVAGKTIGSLDPSCRYAGTGGNGGGIYTDGDYARLRVYGESLVNSNSAYAGATPGLGLVGGNGGGIYLGSNSSSVTANTLVLGTNDGTSLVTDRASVVGNYAQFNGGGIYAGSYSHVLIDADTAGGFTAIASNVAGLGNGGGIFASDNSVITSQNETQFLINQARNGGGIYNDRGTVNLDEAHVRYNIASSRGGGIFNYGNQTLQGVANITDSDIEYNLSASGGGIYNQQAFVNLHDSIVDNNIATDGNGGGIANKVVNAAWNGGDVLLDGTSVSFNRAFDNASQGGGIYNDNGFVRGYGNATNATTINNNYAGFGGGIFNKTGGIINLQDFNALPLPAAVTGDVHVDNNEAKNGAGGGIFNNAGAVALRAFSGGIVSVDNNTAATNGGGIFTTGSNTVSLDGDGGGANTGTVRVNSNTAGLSHLRVSAGW